MYCMKNGNLEIKTKQDVYMISNKKNIKINIHHNKYNDCLDKYQLSLSKRINGNFSIIIAQRYIQTFYGDYSVDVYTNNINTEYYIYLNRNFFETC